MIRENSPNVGIAAVSIGLAAVGGSLFAGLSGMTYVLTLVIMSVHGFLNGRRRQQLEERMGFN